MSHLSYLFGYSLDVNQLSITNSSKNNSHDEPSSSLPILGISFSLRIRHDTWYVPSSSNNNLAQLYHRGTAEEIVLQRIYLTSSVVMSYDRFYIEISKLFGDWEQEFQGQRESLVESIMSQIRGIAESNKGHGGIAELSVDIKLVCRDVFEESVLFSDLSTEYNGMVPASKLSVQSLLKKTETDDENITKDDECMVCLEELLTNEILSMPCSHMFHGECITKWLETSHYCPICRFEMPIQE